MTYRDLDPKWSWRAAAITAAILVVVLLLTSCQTRVRDCVYRDCGRDVEQPIGTPMPQRNTDDPMSNAVGD